MSKVSQDYKRLCFGSILMVLIFLFSFFFTYSSSDLNCWSWPFDLHYTQSGHLEISASGFFLLFFSRLEHNSVCYLWRLGLPLQSST